MDRTPNHICKNPSCHNGEDGGKKHYWACNGCDKRNSWKEAACCEECYMELCDFLAISRGRKNVEVDGQISIFDVAHIAPEPVVPDPEVSELDTSEPSSIVEPKKASNAPFMGYYNKKNKHR